MKNKNEGLQRDYFKIGFYIWKDLNNGKFYLAVTYVYRKLYSLLWQTLKHYVEVSARPY